MDLPDAGTIAAELSNAAAMMIHGCRRARWRIDPASEKLTEMATDLRAIIGRHQQLWLSRNRVGGLRDSVRRMESRLAEYGTARVGSAFG